MPRANSSKTLLQKLYESAIGIAATYLVFGSILDTASNSQSLISIKSAIILTIMLLVASISLLIWAKSKGIKWIHNNTIVLYREFHLKNWMAFAGILSAIWIGPFIDFFREDKLVTSAPKPYTLTCEFPKIYNQDTLYILVTRFESDVNKVETGCFGKALRDRIDQKANQHHIPIRVCYSDSLYPQTHSEAKQFQKRYYADLVLWGDISNVKTDCSNGDFCFYSQPSDSLIRAIGGEVKVETDIIKYQKGVSPEKIREGDFLVKFKVRDYSFDKWLLSVYNLKIGTNNPDFYAIDESIDQIDLINEYLQRGNLYIQFNRYDRALQDYDKIIQINPGITDAYIFRSFIKLELGDKQGALEDCNKATQIVTNDDFSNTLAYTIRGYVKSQLGDTEGTLQDLDKAIQIYPNNAMAHVNRGIIKSELGDKQGAIQDYNKTIQVDPSAVQAYINRAVIKNNLGDKQGAFQDYNKAIQIDPNNAQAYFNRGGVKAELGDVQGALQDFDKAIQIDTNNTMAYTNRGVTKFNLGDTQGALQDYNKAIQIDPNDAVQYKNRGLAKFKLGDSQGALQDFDKAIQINPNVARYYVNRGLAKLKLGDKKGALQDHNKAIQIDPNDAMAYNNRGTIKAELGDLQGTLKDYNKADQINPDHTKAYSNQKILEKESKQSGAQRQVKLDKSAHF